MGTNTTLTQSNQGGGSGPVVPDLGLRIVPPQPPVVACWVDPGDAMPAPPVPLAPPTSLVLR